MCLNTRHLKTLWLPKVTVSACSTELHSKSNLGARVLLVILLFLNISTPAYSALNRETLQARTDLAVVENWFGSLALFSLNPNQLEHSLELRNPQQKLLDSQVFRVVRGETDETLPISDFAGRNVLYHLIKARKYFQSLDANNECLNKPIIVRVGVDRRYNVITKYSEEPSYNNARFIPDHYDGKWSNEMWFHPRKQKTKWKKIGMSIGLSAALEPHLLPLAIPLAIIQNHSGGFDSSLIPSIIYHEAFHWATNSEHLLKTYATRNPLAEDLANYFGSSIWDKPEMACLPGLSNTCIKFKRIKKVRSHLPAKSLYHPFLPALLWTLGKKLGKKAIDHLAWELIKKMNNKDSYLEFYHLLADALAPYPEELQLLQKNYKSFEKLEKQTLTRQP